MQSYRLEVAVRRVYGLSPLIASASSKICVEVRFLDFPPIVIHPQGYAIGDSVTYNICHKADFRMSDEQASTIFPAMCQCQLVGMKEAVAGATKWSCPCLLTPQSNAAAQPPLRMYADYVISNAAGETVGYADMSCRVLWQDASSTAPAQASTPAPSFAPAPQASATATALPVAAPPAHHAELSRGASADQGKPYIVRVVVGESDRHRRPSQPTRWDGMHDASRRHQATPTRTSDSDCGQPQRCVRANTAEKNSLLHLLQYDVAYQLQSLSETVAAALHREHDVLARTPLKGADKTDAVSILRLIKSIDQHVGSIVRVANIILQVANQLVDNSTTPPHIGTSREVKDTARQWRNPVNKLPLPAEGSVGYYLQYEVLYQLQCLGTNLSYMILAYRSALDTPLSSIPTQHIEYCDELGHEIQQLTKHINILIQSSVDGTLSTAAPSAVPEPAAEGKRQKRGKKNSQRTSPATAPQLAPPKITDVTKSLSSTSYSSFSSVRSSLSSSSLSSSLNRPPARTSPPPAPTAITLLAPQPPADPSPQTAASTRSATSQSLPQPSSYHAPGAKIPSSHTSLSLPTQPPPPYTVAASLAHPTVIPLSTPAKLQTDLSSSDSIKSPSVTAPPVSLSTAPQSTGLHNSASSPTQPPVLVTGGPPVLSPPYLSSVPPPLAVPTPLTPTGAAPSPPSLATPRLVTPVSTQPQPQVPLGIPIPVPIPR